jgi:hypothetical protein
MTESKQEKREKRKSEYGTVTDYFKDERLYESFNREVNGK